MFGAISRALIVTFLIRICFPQIALTQSNSMKALSQEVSRLHRQGKYAEAVRIARRAAANRQLGS
jgi:hypothetical protein